MPKKDKFDYSRYTDQQLQAARMMCDPDVKMTLKQIAAEVGVAERTVYRWREDDEFIELINYLSDQYMDGFIGEVYKSLQSGVKKGSTKALELALKRAGKLVDKREVVSDVNVNVHDTREKSNDVLLAELKDLERRLLEGRSGRKDVTPVIESLTDGGDGE